MSTANLDSADLKAVQRGGAIREDVMNQLWDLSDNGTWTPFTNSIGSDTTGNSYAEWYIDKLAAPDVDNAAVDGSDSDQDDTSTGNRVGNHCQISRKEVRVSTRANESNSIASQGKLANQVMRRQIELRRDVDAILLQPQASVADDGNTTAGRVGGFPSWIETAYYAGVGGDSGGFNLGTGLVAAPTPGTIRALTETAVRDACQAIYEEGGNPTMMLSTSSVIRKFSEYMFDSSARIATLSAETNQRGPATAMGSVNVFLTDFGVTLKMVANRNQQLYNSGTAANVFIYDPEYLRQTFLHGYRVDPLAKTGLSDKRQMVVDYTLKVLNERAHAVIADIDPTAPVTP